MTIRNEGLFDLQVNGYAGVDFNDAAITADAMDHALSAMLRAGVTRCLPTLITAPAPILAARLSALDAAVAASRLGPLMVPGFHLEGPFLNPGPGFRGCHPADEMVPPDAGLLGRLCDGLRRPVLLLTLAPELDGAEAVIRWARARGMTVALGHHGADVPCIARAAAAGAALCTHLGNGLPPTLPKLANPLIAQLAEDRLHASFIADGIHVPPEALRVMIRAKGLARSILVTDATAAAAAPPGAYGFAGMTIEHHADGSARLPGSGALAGSALTLDRAVSNVIHWEIAMPEQALDLACGNPARLLAAPPADAEAVWSDGARLLSVRAGRLSIAIAADAA